MGRDRRTTSSLKAFGCISLVCLLFLLVQSHYAFGQVDEGSITGTVQDTTGAVVPDALVTLLNTDQGITLQTKSSSSGGYTFSPVRIGHYELTVTAKGFAKTTQKNLTVNVAQSLLVNIQLKLGAATETVEVTTAPPLLQTEEASVGQVVDERAVGSLPLNGRNFTFLAQLGAGMQTPEADTRGNAASGAFSANGLRPAQNNYLLDGIDDNSNAVDFLNGTNYVILPPLDAIEEFKVQTADFSAELGRSAGAVLNATIKSGTNSFHGDVWEYFRNDKLDAADYFEQTRKGELRLNQFGFTAGGPIIRNKVFVFGDYEGKRRVQGNPANASVPTALQRTSGYTNLTELITGNEVNGVAATNIDAVGRTIPVGTVLDPATSRSAIAGGTDSVSGRPVPIPVGGLAGQAVYVRDPFGTCPASTASFTLATCNLNQLPATGRIDPKAVTLLNLFPAPTQAGISGNYKASPNLFEHANSFDTRVDYNATAKDQSFARFSYVDDPQYIPGPFGGIADGGSFQEGVQTAKSSQMVAGYTHVFTPMTINQVRAGFAHLHTTRYGPEGGTTGLPEIYGIPGVSTVAENGGLPAFTFNGLSTLGSNNFLPSDEISQTLQVTDDFTKIYGKHSFKMGIEIQNVKFSTLQPAWSRGQYDYSGQFTDIPGNNTKTTGIAQFLVTPEATTVGANGVSFSGGSDDVRASNINKTYDEKKYLAGYFQDDWKMTPKLTLNLGLRWDYFGPINETNGGQANFIQSGAPDGKAEILMPKTGKTESKLGLATGGQGFSTSFNTLLAADNIALNLTDAYGKGLLQTQKTNFAPRVGFAYQINPKIVARGGFGLFFNSFENQGYGPNIGENYPFVYNFEYNTNSDPGANAVTPVSVGTPYATATCNAAGGTPGPGGTAVFEAGFSCISFDPLHVNASGLGLQGLQFDYQTPRTYSANLTVQYSLTRTLSAQAAYVLTDGQNLQYGYGDNEVSQILPANISTKPYVPFPDFGQGGSYQRTVGNSQYNGLQTKLEQQFDNGLTYLLTYTWSKTLSDAGDLLNGGNTGSNRAPWVPGLGPKFDRGLADFNIAQVLHFSGGYELPFGKNKRYMNHAGAADLVLGGWSTNWIVSLEGGQPLNIGCPVGVTSGTNCNSFRVAGQSQKLGIKTTLPPNGNHGEPFWFGNPGAFAQACELGPNGPLVGTPAGCVPLTGSAILGSSPGQTVTPGVHKFDLSMFKGFQLSNRFSAQFRAEFFNILNHPNFNAPGFGGNGVVAISNSTTFTPNNNSTFGQIGSTRDAPFDPRQIQFALKLFY